MPVFDHIAVVCTGNICRSPMAEALLQRQWPQRTVFSAGVAAMVGCRAEPYAIEVMLERGFDISAHRARQATPALLTSAQLILALDQSHYDVICRSHPALRGRVHKLGRWRGNIDVPDPYLEPKSAFE